MYRIKVTPELQPWQRGEAAEYLVQGIVEVRKANTFGTASVMTQDNRIYYGRGETISGKIILRSAGAALPETLVLRLQQGDSLITALNLPLKAGVNEVTFFRAVSFDDGSSSG